MVEVGTEPCCANCPYHGRSHGFGSSCLECHYEPPKIFMIPIQTKGVIQGQSAIEMKFQSKYPDVDPQGLCGRHPQHPAKTDPSIWRRPTPPAPPPKK
jgi:hypothetical protein